MDEYFSKNSANGVLDSLGVKKIRADHLVYPKAGRAGEDWLVRCLLSCLYLRGMDKG